jgi:hypothetical protein
MNVAAKQISLTQELVKRLTRGGASRSFMIIENELIQTKSLHVTIVWNEWYGVEMAVRSRVILDAYEKTQRKSDYRITVALGLTGREAIEAGLLPYRIETNRRQDDRVKLIDLARAMAKVGDGILIKDGKRLELRFPTIERAEATYRTLLEQVPGPFWKLVQEVSGAA